MTRPHTYDPPPHLAAVAHTHSCPKCARPYACYNAQHEPNTPRLCGSTGCK